MLETIGRTRLRDVVAQRIQQYIADEGLRPGDRLPTEGELATRFGVSRLSLREATKSLEFIGVLEARPGRGLTVGRMRMERITGYLGLNPALQEADPAVLIDTRVIIETGVLPHVARRMKDDPALYDGLSGINARLRDARTLQRWVTLDIEFHRSLIEASGLTPLMAFADVLAVFFQRFRESVRKAEWSGGVVAHQAILDDLRAGRVSRAETQLRTHIESHRTRIVGPAKGEPAE
ncbi:MAG: FadR family transcriptional regulator [Planctomyces sp.]|nr:FadR family transcriptional regulator [Planctomyces sp.]